MALTHEALLDYYRTPGIFTSIERFGREIDRLPGDIGALVGAVQQTLLHEAWTAAYAAPPPAERAAEKELCSASALLTRASRLSAAAIGEARPPEERVLGVCRHFATLFVAFARRKGIAARARAGFADYFEPQRAGEPIKHVEHWVAEYWREDQQRWVLIDTQIDPVQQALVRPDFDTRDVPRNRFLVAGDAWRACRNGADPATFGVGGTQMWGLAEVFGELFQDIAALHKIELLPWQWYGLARDTTAVDSETELIDRLADLSSTAAAAAVHALRQLVDADPRLAVPAHMLDAIIAADEATTLA